jgi:TolB-like protein
MRRSFLILFLVFIASALSAQNNPFFEGTGGAGIRIAVLQPSGSGLSQQEQWLLRLVQSTLTGDFNKFSAMTVIDRQNLDKIMGIQNESLLGNFSEADFISIGKLTNARYITAGTVTKTSGGFILELAVSDAQTGVRTASFTPKNCSLDELQSTSIIRQASEELLAQMGVKLTAVGKQSLRESVSAVPQAASGAEARAGTSSTVTDAYTDEDARRREDNFQRMAFKIENGTLVEFRGSGWEEAIIPPEVTVIGDAAFRQNGRIKRVVLHNKVTAIGRNAFANCTGLVQIVIPSSVTVIGAGAFANCKNLKTVTILNDKITIGRRAFMGTSLTNKEEMIKRFGETVFN